MSRNLLPVCPPVLVVALGALFASHTSRSVAQEVPPPPPYTVADLGALAVGGLDAKHAGQVRADIAYAVNAHGAVTGEAFIPGGGGFAFLYRNGVVTSLGTLGTSERPTSQARGRSWARGTSEGGGMPSSWSPEIDPGWAARRPDPRPSVIAPTIATARVPLHPPGDGGSPVPPGSAACRTSSGHG